MQLVGQWIGQVVDATRLSHRVRSFGVNTAERCLFSLLESSCGLWHPKGNRIHMRIFHGGIP